MDNAATEHFNPFVFVKNLKFKAGLGKWKIGVNPPHLGIWAEQILYNFFDMSLHIMDNILNSDLRLVSEHVDCLHLMKNGVMELVNFISSINIA